MTTATLATPRCATCGKFKDSPSHRPNFQGSSAHEFKPRGPIEARRITGGDYEIWNEGELWGHAKREGNGPRPPSFALKDITGASVKVPDANGKPMPHFPERVSQQRRAHNDGGSPTQVVQALIEAQATESISTGMLRAPAVLHSEREARARAVADRANADRAKRDRMRADLIDAYTRNPRQGLADAFEDIFLTNIKESL